MKIILTRRKLFSCVSILFAVAPAYSSASSNNDMYAPHPYIGAKLGWTHFGNGCESNHLECDIDSLGGGIFLGYKFGAWLSVEGGIMTIWEKPKLPIQL